MLRLKCRYSNNRGAGNAVPLGVSLLNKIIKEIVMSEEPKTFEEIVKPVMEWLAKNKHPHMIVIIEATRAELVEGVECVATDEFVPD
jgi:hypothetical protein